MAEREPFPLHSIVVNRKVAGQNSCCLASPETWRVRAVHKDALYFECYHCGHEILGHFYMWQLDNYENVKSEEFEEVQF